MYAAEFALISCREPYAVPIDNRQLPSSIIKLTYCTVGRVPPFPSHEVSSLTDLTLLPCLPPCA